MTALQQLFRVEQGDTFEGVTNYVVTHTSSPIMLLERINPKLGTFRNYWYTFIWETLLQNRDCVRGLAESYTRLKQHQFYSELAEELLASIRATCGPNFNGMITLSREQYGIPLPYVGLMPGVTTSEIIETIDSIAPNGFGYIFLSSDHGMHSIENQNGTRMIKFTTEFCLLEEVVELFEATSSHQVPKAHKKNLVDKLSEVVNR